MPLPPAAVLFDLDGTLLDSEPLHHASTNVVLAEYGHNLSKADFRPFIGSGEVAYWSALRERFALEMSVRELIERRNDAYVALMESAHLEPLPGVHEVLDHLSDRGIPFAVVSAAPRRQVDAGLLCAGLAARIALRLSGEDDVPRSKPHPDAYLAAAAALAVRPEQCIAVEDSATGIASARAAGTFVVGITVDPHPQPDPDRAHMRLASLHEFHARLRGA
ncbi:MAG TPA: HAD family phosphatase [Planctomycetota bacterium]